MPAAIEPHTFTGEPPAVPSLDGRLEIGSHRDEDVDCHDDERERLEPMLGTDPPLVLDHHEADTSSKGCIQLGIVEPSVHIQMRLVLQCPFRSVGRTDGDSDEIDGQESRNDKEHDGTASLGAASKFIQEDEAEKHDQQHPPLSKGVSPINLEKHNFND